MRVPLSVMVYGRVAVCSARLPLTFGKVPDNGPLSEGEPDPAVQLPPGTVEEAGVMVTCDVTLPVPLTALPAIATESRISPVIRAVNTQPSVGSVKLGNVAVNDPTYPTSAACRMAGHKN